MVDDVIGATQRVNANGKAVTVRIPVPSLLSAAAGALLMYFLDPDRGRSRWTLVRDRTAGAVRHTSRRVRRIRHRTAADVYAIKQKMTHLRSNETTLLNDADLVQRVETALFRDPDIPKGEININAEYGKIVLRGDVPRRGMIRAIERKVRKMQGVREVENYLHLIGEPAPNKELALHASHNGAHIGY